MKIRMVILAVLHIIINSVALRVADTSDYVSAEPLPEIRTEDRVPLSMFNKNDSRSQGNEENVTPG